MLLPPTDIQTNLRISEPNLDLTTEIRITIPTPYWKVGVDSPDSLADG